MRSPGAEPFWYVLGRIWLGVAYFAKIPAKKAMWEMAAPLQGAPADYQAALAHGLYGQPQNY